MKSLFFALEKMEVPYKSVETIQQKDGIVVARVICEKGSFILKFFENREYAREIENYRILCSLHIPTLHVEAITDNALLLEDICGDSTYRLGTKKDLENPKVAVQAAKWYRRLHEEGYRYLEKNRDVALYDENDVITPENIEGIKRKTNTSMLPVWKLIEDNFDLIKKLLNKIERTLTYNDFYYTNLAVLKDGTSAIMFDYNLLGKGYAYADIRNVCSALSEEAGKAFCEEYGELDEMEVMLDGVASVLVTLQLACQKEQFPFWAKGALAELSSGYAKKVERLLLAP